MRDQQPRRRTLLRRLSVTWMTASVLAGTMAGIAAPARVVLATDTVKLTVQSARTEPLVGVTEGDPITSYHWMINEDNTGTTATRSAAPGTPCSPWQDAAHTIPNTSYPGSCDWASIAGLETNAPVVAQGTEADPIATDGITLPEGRYLISVLADGYKLDGTPFSIPDDDGEVVVPLQPWPLPTATIKAQVFRDDTEVNGAYDPGEAGLSRFSGKIADSLGQVNTDVFGNPLCTTYAFNDANHDGVQDPGEATILDADLAPTMTREGGKCLSGDINLDGVVNATDEALYASKGLDPTVARGVLTIPNVGPNRYALSMVPPTGEVWVQTTTLEGNHDWDSWAMEGATGYDTEFVIAGEPFPPAVFGYVPGPGTTSYWSNAAHKFASPGSATITGHVEAMDIYTPPKGGLDLPTLGFSGAKIDHPIDRPWITLSDLNAGDTAVWIGRGDANGVFTISGVPDGSYTLTYWDEPQDYILDLLTVTVENGQPVDMGLLPMAGWFAKFSGFVFNDLNENGFKDPGEPGVPNFALTMRRRENALMDRGNTGVSTDQSGYYEFPQTYPMTQWLVMEAYDDRYYTTGITYQADNQDEPTTVHGHGVDVSVLPIIGLSGTLDWGVRPYDATGANGLQNGGIVGSISYDTTRNELDPQYAAAEDWQPGVPGITVELWSTVPCGTTQGAPCDARGDLELASDGSYAKGTKLNTYVSEQWDRPTDCVARDVDGNALANPADQQVLPVDPAGQECLEGPLSGIQFGPYTSDPGTPDENFGAAVDGNYGFGDACIDGTLDATDPSAPTCKDGSGNDVPFTPLDAGDYLVSIDLADKTDSFDQPIYQVTREEDINIGNGDQWVPQVPPPACAGALHIVDVAGIGARDGYDAMTIDDPSGNAGGSLSVPASTPTENPTFVGIDGSPYEGTARPLCDTKLVSLQNGKSIVPMFNVFTDVPLPSRFFGLTVDDLTFSTDPKSLLFGEKAGLPFNPVGIYDFSNRLITTVETDYNGIYDVLLPSTNRINCPTPSGVCANVYRFVGNDPGVPGRLNLNYDPRYRTIAADFEGIPGVTIPADTAPTQVGVVVQLPGGQPQVGLTCPVNPPDATASTMVPELYAVSRPYTTGTTPGFKVLGKGFGAAKGSGQLTLDGVPVATASWSDTVITVTDTLSPSIGQGPHQLRVTASNGRSTVNGLTFHRIGGSYNPPLYEVGPTSNENYTAAKAAAGRWFTPEETLPAAADHAIQEALDAAPAGALVVVYPNKPSADPRQNPRGAYYENLIISKRVKLQGVGPGSPNPPLAPAPDGSVRGTILDGGAFGGDGPVAGDWYTALDGRTWAGNQTVYDGAVISLYLPSNGGNSFPTGTFSAATAASIDGFDLRGGDQMGFPGNINEIGGTPTGQPGGLITQGGAIFANGYARNLQISNNVVQNNGGAYGTIRIGNPDVANNENDGVRLMTNRIIANAGTNLAGAVGIFGGADGYRIIGNDICGNFSAEYGGGISAYGFSPGGVIDHNRVYYNQSYDEGGGIMIAGVLPATPTALSPGTGAVTISANLVQANMANDDGGGIRFLMSASDCNAATNGMQPCAQDVVNNFIVNNVSTHEGGGIALDDAPNVRIVNNTIMSNITTATAATSNGQPAPAGLSTGQNSTQLQARLLGGIAGCGTGTNAKCFSDPLLFNDIFWGNWAGTSSLGTVTGIGQQGDASPVHVWDLGAVDGSVLSPSYSIVQQNAGSHPYNGSSNYTTNPLVVSPYATVLDFAPWRTQPTVQGAILVASDLPPGVLGDYHLSAAVPPAYNKGIDTMSVPLYQRPPTTYDAPSIDIDDQGRPGQGGFDIGADELPSPTADLAVTKSDGVTSPTQGSTVTYTITVSNTGPSTATNATVSDVFPASLAVTSWTCAVPAGSPAGTSCTATGSGNSRGGTVTLPMRSSVIFTGTATVSATAGGTIANKATVAVPGGISDPNDKNNEAIDSDFVQVARPTLTGLDTFTGPNLTTGLGPNWSQANANLRRNNNQAFGNSPGQAIWNGTTGGGPVYGSKQGAQFSVVGNGNGTTLILKASAAPSPASFIRVRISTGNGGEVLVESTANSGGTYTTLAGGPFAATFATGDTLTAVANADGSVDLWRNTTYLGRTATSAFTGTGQIGIALPNNGRADNFSGGTVP